MPRQLPLSSVDRREGARKVYSFVVAPQKGAEPSVHRPGTDERGRGRPSQEGSMSNVQVLRSVPDEPHAHFDSFDPATGAVVASMPIDDQIAVVAAVDRAREASKWWRALGFDGRARHLASLQGRARPAHRRARGSCASRERETERRRGPRDRRRARSFGMGTVTRSQGARRASGPDRLAGGQQLGDRRVPTSRCSRGDRPVELPGLHADGVHRLRACRWQRGGVQAQRVHAGSRSLARRRLGESGARRGRRVNRW